MIIDQIIWLPILTGFMIIALGEKRSEISYRISLFISILVFMFSVYALCLFDPASSGFQFVIKTQGIERLKINYHLGVDRISIPLIILTTFLTPIVIYTAKTTSKNKLHQYLASFLLLEGLMVGVFSAMDAFLFYVFWEAMLIPMFLIIGVWGCLLYTSPSPRDLSTSRMPSSA